MDVGGSDFRADFRRAARAQRVRRSTTERLLRVVHDDVTAGADLVDLYRSHADGRRYLVITTEGIHITRAGVFSTRDQRVAPGDIVSVYPQRHTASGCVSDEITIETTAGEFLEFQFGLSAVHEQAALDRDARDTIRAAEQLGLLQRGSQRGE